MNGCSLYGKKEKEIHEILSDGESAYNRACEKSLSADIVWRLKQEFSRGARSASSLKNHFGKEISHEELVRARQTAPRIQKKEKLYYTRIVTCCFGSGRLATCCTGSWSTAPGTGGRCSSRPHVERDTERRKDEEITWIIGGNRFRPGGCGFPLLAPGKARRI